MFTMAMEAIVVDYRKKKRKKRREKQKREQRKEEREKAWHCTGLNHVKLFIMSFGTLLAHVLDLLLPDVLFPDEYLPICRSLKLQALPIHFEKAAYHN